MEIMQYIYGALWLIIALLLIFKFSVESKWFYLAGGWFALFGILTIVNEVLDGALLTGILRWIFQGLTGVVAVILIIVFLTEGRRSRSSPSSEPLESLEDSQYEDDDLSNQEDPAGQDAPYDPPYEAPGDDPYRN